MIRKVQGNILEAEVEALVNTVNTVGVMGRGIALQFKRAFPKNYEAYRKVCERGELRTGRVFTFDLNRLENPRYIINFPTKRHWREKSKLEYIEQGLKALVQEIQRLGIKSIALPPLGSGLGRLNWAQVYERIEKALGGLTQVKVLVYEPTGAPDPANMPDRTTRPRMTPGRAALLGLMKVYLTPLMDESITLLELHKLMYFLQESGEALRLAYVKGVYGPYSENLHHVLERIEGHFIIGYGEGKEAPGKVIDYKDDAMREAEQFLASRVETQARLKRVEALIQGFETPYGMELLSSVHWVVKREDSSASVNPSLAVELVQAWNKRKRDLFAAQHIQRAWERLKDQQWL